MTEGWTARTPNYYLVAFSGSNINYPIDHGVYPYPKQYGKNVKTGDMLLLYQELGVRGIGIVIDVFADEKTETIDYQFFRIDPDRTWLDQTDVAGFFPELKFGLYLYPNWIQPINKSSFQKALDNRQINW